MFGKLSYTVECPKDWNEGRKVAASIAMSKVDRVIREQLEQGIAELAPGLTLKA